MIIILSQGKIVGNPTSTPMRHLSKTSDTGSGLYLSPGGFWSVHGFALHVAIYHYSPHSPLYYLLVHVHSWPVILAVNCFICAFMSLMIRYFAVMARLKNVMTQDLLYSNLNHHCMIFSFLYAFLKHFWSVKCAREYQV